MIKNIIFDVDGVLRKLNDEPVTSILSDELLEKYKGRYDGITIKKYFSKFLHNDIFKKYDLGFTTQDEMIDEISAYFNEPKEIIKFLLDARCKRQYNTIFEPTMNLVGKLKDQKYKTYILSNMGQEAADVLKIYIDISKFDDIIFSCEVGIIKPHPEMYSYALNRFGIKANESIFVDDRQENLAPFEKYGGSTFLFDSNNIEGSVKKLEETINQNGLQMQ